MSSMPANMDSSCLFLITDLSLSSPLQLLLIFSPSVFSSLHLDHFRLASVASA